MIDAHRSGVVPDFVLRPPTGSYHALNPSTKLVLAFADYCRWTLTRPGEFITLADELKHI